MNRSAWLDGWIQNISNDKLQFSEFWFNKTNKRKVLYFDTFLFQIKFIR